MVSDGFVSKQSEQAIEFVKHKEATDVDQGQEIINTDEDK